MAEITIDQLNARLVAIHAEMQGLQSAADGEGRDLSPEETEKFATLKSSFDATEKEIERRRQLHNMAAKLDAPGQRVVVPEDVESAAPTQPQNHSKPKRTPGLEGAREKGTGGFQSFGDYAMKVIHASVNPAGQDPRLKLLNAAATTSGAEGVGADGGYLVPPDFKSSLLEKVMGEDSLLSRTDQVPTTSNAVTIPVDEDEPWSTSGITAYWAGEGVAPTQSKPALRAVTVRAEKMIALVPVTDELLSDAPSLEAYLRNKAPAKMLFKLNDAILNGDGAGKPLGILKSTSGNANALVTQAAEGGQATATIVYNNVTKMWSRMYAPSRRKAVWLINQDIEPQLYSMVVPGTQAAFPAFLPAGGLSNQPYDTLMGRPVVYTEACATVGTVGDIVLADLSQYLTVLKNGGVRTDVSIHLFFDADQTAFRFILRVGGQPWWSKTITRAKGGNTLSAYVALATRP
jgi:HK97 family phage major capsid protein